MMPKKICGGHGFSLIEIAVVLVIISVLVSIVAIPISTQLEQQRVVDTNKQLEGIKEALIGYALANGRLPCPATDGSTYGTINSSGAEAPVGGGACSVKLGYVPAATLGVSPVDSSGFAIDSWGLSKNRILYAVADINVTASASCPTPLDHPLTTTSGIKTIGMDCLASPKTLITVCSATPTGSAGAATGCPAGTSLTTTAPFVLLSLGKNAPTGGSGADEAHNVDGKLISQQDLFFVAHTPTPSGAAAGEFDDLVAWPSLNTVFARMVQAGKLP